MNLTTLRQRRQQHHLERAWQQQASSIPTPWPRRPWLFLLGAGVVIGLGLGWAHQWLIRPIKPAEQRCNFQLAPLDPADLEPRLTPEQEARIRGWLGPQLPKAPAPAPPPPAVPERC